MTLVRKLVLITRLIISWDFNTINIIKTEKKSPCYLLLLLLLLTRVHLWLFR